MNQIQYFRDDLDAEIKRIETSLANDANFSTKRLAAYKNIMGQYNAERIAVADDFIIDDNFAAPLATGGSADIDTTLYDVFRTALPSGVGEIFGDTILLQQGTGVFEKTARTTLADMVLTGGSQLLIGFATHNGVIDIISKQGEFAAPGNMAFMYFRVLDATLPDASTTPLDIRAQDFAVIAQRVSEAMKTL